MSRAMTFPRGLYTYSKAFSWAPRTASTIPLADRQISRLPALYWNVPSPCWLFFISLNRPISILTSALARSPDTRSIRYDAIRLGPTQKLNWKPFRHLLRLERVFWITRLGARRGGGAYDDSDWLFRDVLLIRIKASTQRRIKCSRINNFRGQLWLKEYLIGASYKKNHDHIWKRSSKLGILKGHIFPKLSISIK